MLKWVASGESLQPSSQRESSEEDIPLRVFLPAREADDAERRQRYGSRTAVRPIYQPGVAMPMSTGPSLLGRNTAQPIMAITPTDPMAVPNGVRPRTSSFTHDDRLTSNSVGSTKDRREYLFSFPSRGNK